MIECINSLDFKSHKSIQLQHQSLAKFILQLGTPSYSGKSWAHDTILFGGANEYLGWSVGQVIIVVIFFAWSIAAVVERYQWYARIWYK